MEEVLGIVKEFKFLLISIRMGIVVMGMLVPRDEIRFIESTDDWLLLYGRRKTGKSFLIQNFVRFDEYYFISRSGRVYVLQGDIF